MGYPTRELALKAALLDDAERRLDPPPHIIRQPEGAQMSIYDHPPKGPSTYLHAGFSQNGWPYDHSTEDAYEVPAHIVRAQEAAKEYRAEFGTDGSARLYLHTPPKLLIATFETMADAQTAAKALNELKGY